VQKQHEKLGFQHVFSKYKKKCRDQNSLITALIRYKLTDNFSISKSSEWINREEVLELFELKGFQERTLFRALETIGENKE
jgi:transposase